MNRGGGVPEVGGADRERCARPSRPGNAAVAGAGRPVVAGRGNDEHVEPKRSGDRPRGWTVLERRERLGDSHERDSRGIERHAVRVRVDRALEPGDELIGSPEDCPPPAGLPLPARDADREARSPRGRRRSSGRGPPSRRAARPAECRAARSASDPRGSPSPPRPRPCRRRRSRCSPGRGGRDGSAECPCRAGRSSPRGRRSRAGRRPAARRPLLRARPFRSAPRTSTPDT